MKISLLCSLIACVLVFSGCRLAGIALSPSSNEMKVGAEYPLFEHSEEKLLVFVEGTVNSGASEALEGELYIRVAVGCRDKCDIDKDNIIPIEAIKKLESETSDFSRLTPVDIAKKLGADVVLYVLIEKYDLYEVGAGHYYEGSITCRGILFNAGNGAVLWPRTSGGEVSHVKLEIESRGVERAKDRLLATTTHNLLRKLYDCPVNTFKTESDSKEFYNEGW